MSTQMASMLPIHPAMSAGGDMILGFVSCLRCRRASKLSDRRRTTVRGAQGFLSRATF